MIHVDVGWELAAGSNRGILNDRLLECYRLVARGHQTKPEEVEQAEGTGRLDPKKMRDFLRSLAWEMHSRSIDSMDPSEVMPILKLFYPNTAEQDLAELAEVAVVNCPELTKGEETGFEFVHKSFAEFLVGERIADLVEKVAFKAPEYGSDELTWRMSEQEAARQLSPMLGIRLVPSEVQEMFEPMLGCFGPFSKGDRVDEVVTAGTRKDGLLGIVERFEYLFADFLRGASLETVAKTCGVSPLARSSLEGYANYCAGLLVIGTAASRQLRQFQTKEKPHRLFVGDPFRGAFWRSLCVLAAGGLTLDETLAERLLDGVGIAATEDSPALNDFDSPLKLGFLNYVEGYNQSLTKRFVDCIHYTNALERMVFVTQLLLQSIVMRKRSSELDERMSLEWGDYRVYRHEREGTPIRALAMELEQSGLAPHGMRREFERYMMDYRHVMDRMVHEMRGNVDIEEVIHRFLKEPYTHDRLYMGREFEHNLRSILAASRIKIEDRKS